MIDLEVVAVADAAKHRAQDRLVDVIDALAARAHQVMVMFGDAGDVRGHVTRSLEPRCHARLDLRLECPVDGREPQARMATMKALVELLRGHGLPLGGERLRDDDPLLGESSAA